MDRSEDKNTAQKTSRESARAKHLKAQLGRASSGPGVYLMKGGKGKILYVGKAGNLKKRLSSYFKRPDQLDVKTAVMFRQIADIETVITRNEKEALILESNLIKQHTPRYNVVLKDDKRYPSIRLNRNHPFPNLTIVRKTPEDGSVYFGPFSSAYSVRQTLKFIDRHFKLRKCRDNEFKLRTRPCLQYQMGTCWGPCCLDVDENAYREMTREVTLFLEGKTPDLIKKIKKEMLAAANGNDFESAARLRDKMYALEKTLERQVAVTTDFRDRDVIGMVRTTEKTIICLLRIRNGYMLGMQEFDIPPSFVTDAELMGNFVGQYFGRKHAIPSEILVPVLPDAISSLEEVLGKKKGRRVKILTPKRGEKARLLRLAVRNAENRLKEKISAEEEKEKLLKRLGKHLGMDRLPRHIECFDNSNISGTAAVSAMVVFRNGEPAKSDYRKYKVRSVAGPDDYATMAEVFSRRYGKKDTPSPFPDLALIDGGKGQLNIAAAVLDEMGLEGHFFLAAIAKRDETKGETRDKIFVPGRMNPLQFGKDENALLFLERVRDEAHRFVIGYHRKRRTASSFRSALDGIPGIGGKRKKALLKHFGSIRNISNASVEELAALPQMNKSAAQEIKKALSRNAKGL